MHPTPRLAAALLAGSGLGWPLLAQADLVEDSHASLELRNFYFNRDFRQSGALGLPGLSFMSRYVSGDNVARGAANDGKEWERNTDLGYVVQSGPLKNLGVKWRNATVRSNFANDLDENRLILSYSLALW